MIDYRRKMAGFTLIELMVIVVVLVIVMTVAIPNLQEMIKNNRVTAQGNELVSLINYARNEAIRRTDSVTVNISSDGYSWTGEVLDPDGDGDEACAGAALRCSTYEQVQLDWDGEGDPLEIVFNNRGYLEPFDDRIAIRLEHENCAGEFQRRILTIRPTGQLESCRAACGQPCNGD